MTSRTRRSARAASQGASKVRPGMCVCVYVGGISDVWVGGGGWVLAVLQFSSACAAVRRAAALPLCLATVLMPTTCKQRLCGQLVTTGALAAATSRSILLSADCPQLCSPPPPCPGGSGAKKGGKRTTCLNCGCHQTPQWRCGPLGPRTLCNACGVRYKKGLPLNCWPIREGMVLPPGEEWRDMVVVWWWWGVLDSLTVAGHLPCPAHLVVWELQPLAGLPCPASPGAAGWRALPRTSCPSCGSC